MLWKLVLLCEKPGLLWQGGGLLLLQCGERCAGGIMGIQVT